MLYRINELANLAGISERTLRYYDQIGLLIPASRSDTGYRIYSDNDLEKLQQILFWRELGFSLEQIRQLLNQPGFDRRQALEAQINLLQERARHFQRLANLAQDTLNSEKGAKKLTSKDLFTAFNYEQIMEEQKQYEAEVEERWGDTEAYRISKERTSGYTRDDWEKINSVQMDNLKELAELYESGTAYDDHRVIAVVARNLQFISDYFYPCSLELFSCLGNMYITDERFTAFYERIAPGLAAYYNEAIQHFCIKNT